MSPSKALHEEATKAKKNQDHERGPEFKKLIRCRPKAEHLFNIIQSIEESADPSTFLSPISTPS